MINETKKCPFCGEENLADAKECKHCKQVLVQNNNEANEETPNTSEKLNLNNNNIHTIIGVVVVVLVIYALFNAFSNVLLKGCELENEIYNVNEVTKTYYCKKNNLYNKVNIKYTNGSNYPDYSFIIQGGMKIAKYYRNNGEYYCSVYNVKDDIANCDEAKMLDLIKKNIGKINDEIRLDRLKENIKEKITQFHNISSELAFVYGKYQDNLNCEDLINNFRKNNNVKSTNGCQVQFDNDVIMSISKDGKSATIYDSKSPVYYINITHILSNNNSSSNIKYTQEQIPADSYIKDYSKAKLLSKKEKDNVNSKLHYYF